ncbi:hypothetical protein ES703_92697 [subsurface metagenome]
MDYERRRGYPRPTVERVMNHYGVSYDEAVKGIAEGRYPLPERGFRIGQGKAVPTAVGAGVGALIGSVAGPVGAIAGAAFGAWLGSKK